MFKSQMRCQKILCFVCLILAALMFVYSLGYITSYYELLSFTVDKDIGYDYQKVEGVLFYWDLQTVISYEEVEIYDEYDNFLGTETKEIRQVGFVDQLVVVAIIGIVVALTLYITNTQKRRLYYIGNYISTGLFAGYNIGVSAWVMARITYFYSQFKNINFEQLEQFCKVNNKPFDINGPKITTILGYVLCIALILAAIAIVLNLVWKLMLQKREHNMLQQSSVQEVAVNG